MTDPADALQDAFPSREWYLLLEEQPRAGADNMAVDQHLLEQMEAGRIDRPVLRIYRWARPTLSLGYHQQWRRAVDTDALRREGVDLVRRWTGGRAVLHDRELTYSVVAPFRSPFQARIKHNYNLIAGALDRFCAFGQDGTGLASEERAALGPVDRDQARHAPCFAAISAAEIESRGRKLIGSSQKLGRAGFLQHGSIPLESQSELLQTVTGTELEMDAFMDSINAVIARAGLSPHAPEQLMQRLADSFREVFMIRWRSLSELGLPDEGEIERIAATRFRTEAWTLRK